MEYIFNVKAQFEQKKEYNIEAQFEAIKKNIEGQVIHVQAKIDPNSLSLAKIQEQLKNEKLTLNIGNVTFDQSGVDKANKAVGIMSNSLDRAKDSAKGVEAAIKSIIQPGEKATGYIAGLSRLGINTNQIKESEKQLENLGLTIDKITVKQAELNRANTEGGQSNIQQIVTATLQATDQFGKLYTLTQSFDLATGETKTNIVSITDNIKKQAQEQEKANKELEKQRSIYEELKRTVESIAITRSSGNGKLKGFNADDITKPMTLSNDGTVEVTAEMKQFQQASENAIKALNNFDTAIKENNTNTQGYVSTIKTAIAEMKAYGKVIHDQQSGSVGNMGEKDVKALKEAADFQLKTFEERVNSSGLATDEFNKKIANLKTQLSGVKISDDYTKFTDQFRVIKAEFDNITQSAKSATAAVSNTESFIQLITKYNDLIDKASKYEGILESLSREAKNAVVSFAEIRDDGVVNENSLKQARAYYNSIKSAIDHVIDAKNKSVQADKAEQAQYDKLLQDRIKNEKEILELEKQIASFDRVGNKTKTPERDQVELLHLQATQRREDLAKEAESILGVEKAQEQLNAVRTATQNLRDRNDYWKASIQEENQVIEAERQKQSILDRQDEIYQKQLAIRNEIYQTTLAYNKETQSVLGRDSEESQRLAQKLEELHRQEVEINSIAQKELSIDAAIENQNRLREETRANLEQILQLENRINDASRANAIIQSEKMLDSVGKTNNKYTSDTSNSVLSNAENIKRLNAEYDKVIEKINAFKNSSKDTFESTKQSAQSAIIGFNQLAESLKNSEKSIKSADEAIKKLEQDSSKGFFANNANDPNVTKLKQDIDGLRNIYTQLQSQFQSQGSTAQVTQGFATLDERIKSVSQRAVDLQQNLRQTNTELSLTGQKSNLNNRIETWLKNNTKASGNTVQALKQLQAQIQSADKVSLRNLTQQFRDITRNAELAGEAGKSFLDSINEKIGKFSSWFGISQIIMAITNEVKQAIVTFKEMDTILTEISKTSERSAESLAKLGESAFDTASKYGVSVQNYLTGVQEMARAGYETLGEHQSEQMAELALLVQAAGGVSDSVARDYLIATDAAYQLGGSIEKLQSILDSQNKVTNNYAVSMNDMASATKEAASIANQYGVDIDELSALIAMAVSRTRLSGNEVGNSLKSIFVSLSDTTNNSIVKAFDAVDISMYKLVDGSKRLKTPIELLGELAEKFNELPTGDDRRSIVLNDIFGRYRANVGAAILQDWDSMQGIMETYESGAGSAMEEAKGCLYVQKCA